MDLPRIQYCRTSDGVFLFADRGAADLKGFDEPVRLFEVAWREEV